MVSFFGVGKLTGSDRNVICIPMYLLVRQRTRQPVLAELMVRRKASRHGWPLMVIFGRRGNGHLIASVVSQLVGWRF